MEDEHLRSACFASLDVLCAEFGEDVPYVGGLDRGIPYARRRVPFLSTQKGIFRAAAQNGPAALSVQTSWKSPYGDRELDEGFLYAYRDGDLDQPDNRALRAAFTLKVPIVYFWSTRPGRYKPVYPCYVIADDPVARRVLLSPGLMAGAMDDPTRSRSKIRSNGVTRFARRACVCTRHGSEVLCSTRIQTGARSAG